MSIKYYAFSYLIMGLSASLVRLQVEGEGSLETKDLGSREPS